MSTLAVSLTLAVSAESRTVTEDPVVRRAVELGSSSCSCTGSETPLALS